ncbi:hypothetical protein [Actinokineospora cianjurensis]|uniref:Uncharacterized protein n=1 Tax=Actinokineospora cianjurensis TaxID=585224 RepID=A0A421B6D1_9PSEU|nr:hypothetical protein [Actinokineospora cianjurensis]RLK59924.1 hypothetical protein CLV68_0414 [Actinokineospora cianjurensis]
MSDVEITTAIAIARYPDLAELVTARQEGWLFRPLVNEAGAVTGLVGTRHVERYTDALWIYGPTDVLGLRILATEYGGGCVWKHDRGGLGNIVREILALPEPGQRLAPRLVRSPSGLWTP